LIVDCRSLVLLLENALGTMTVHLAGIKRSTQHWDREGMIEE
jgi:hypothetical protein